MPAELQVIHRYVVERVICALVSYRACRNAKISRL